jgi:hypothetical protein
VAIFFFKFSQIWLQAKYGFTVMTALNIAKSSQKSISKFNKDDGVWATNLFSIAQHQAFGTKCVTPSMIA